MGCYYHVAPWPVGSKTLAAQNVARAVAIAPSLRNCYYVGVVSFAHGDFPRAAEYFERAISAECGSATEEDFSEFMRQQSVRGLKLAQERAAQSPR